MNPMSLPRCTDPHPDRAVPCELPLDHLGSHYHYGQDYVLLQWRSAVTGVVPALVGPEVREPAADGSAGSRRLPVAREHEVPELDRPEPDRPEPDQPTLVTAAPTAPDLPAPRAGADDDPPPVSASTILGRWGKSAS